MRKARWYQQISKTKRHKQALVRLICILQINQIIYGSFVFVDLTEKSTNTETFEKERELSSVLAKDTNQVEPSVPQPAPRRTTVTSTDNEDLSLSSQLKQAMYLASTRSALLLEMENRLVVAHARVKTLEKLLEQSENVQPIEKMSDAQTPCTDDNILSVTILSLQNLLQEKDTTMNKYQDLLRVERQNVTASHEDHRKEVKQMQSQLEEIHNQLRSKENELESLRQKQATMENQNSKITVDSQSLPDTLVEEMFLEDRTDPFDVFNSSQEMMLLQRRVQEAEEDARKLHGKLREVSLRENGWERTMCEKDKEIEGLKER